MNSVNATEKELTLRDYIQVFRPGIMSRTTDTAATVAALYKVLEIAAINHSALLETVVYDDILMTQETAERGQK